MKLFFFGESYPEAGRQPEETIRKVHVVVADDEGHARHILIHDGERGEIHGDLMIIKDPEDVLPGAGITARVKLYTVQA